ncbi:hypothetical protein GCM10023336_14230 [Streptomyces similanensis]|uniref:Uncharacterized protein n=1 Tax=Streptomyces similanensis TaxID=1274988 RepID=A0ABP9K1X1_9ACTN
MERGALGALGALGYGRQVEALHQRTLFGNLAQIGGERMRDVKVMHSRPRFDRSTPFLSTMPDSLTNGESRPGHPLVLSRRRAAHSARFSAAVPSRRCAGCWQEWLSQVWHTVGLSVPQPRRGIPRARADIRTGGPAPGASALIVDTGCHAAMASVVALCSKAAGAR